MPRRSGSPARMHEATAYEAGKLKYIESLIIYSGCPRLFCAYRVSKESEHQTHGHAVKCRPAPSRQIARAEDSSCLAACPSCICFGLCLEYHSSALDSAFDTLEQEEEEYRRKTGGSFCHLPTSDLKGWPRVAKVSYFLCCSRRRIYLAPGT